MINTYRRLVVLGFLSLAAAFGSAGMHDARAQTAQNGKVFVDVQWVTDVNAAQDYARWVTPLMRKYGGDTIQVYRVMGVMRGEAKPALVWIYQFPSDTAMQSLMSDPEYKARIASRDKIFDFKKNQVFVVRPVFGQQ